VPLPTSLYAPQNPAQNADNVPESAGFQLAPSLLASRRTNAAEPSQMPAFLKTKTPPRRMTKMNLARLAGAKNAFATVRGLAFWNDSAARNPPQNPFRIMLQLDMTNALD